MHGKRNPQQGIRVRHGRACASHHGGRCNCQPSYEAFVFSKREGRKIRRTFQNLSEAKSWRHDAIGAVRRGTLRSPSRLRLEEKCEAWLEQAERGQINSNKRKPYKPSALRGYRSDLTRYVYPVLGDMRLAEVRRRDVQLLVDDLRGLGLSGSKVRNVVIPLQAVYRHAMRRDEVTVDPTDNLELPEVGGTRKVEVEPEQAAVLLDALPEDLRPLYAAAFYAGPRRGELRAMRVSDVHESAGECWLSVERALDDVEGEIEPKSKAGIRTIPLPETLRAILVEHVERTGRSGEDLLFGRTATLPFTPRYVQKRADEAWSDAELGRITLHECRHCYSTFLDAAGISETRADRYMGHSNGGVAGRYRHQLKRQLVQDAERLDDYLTGSTAKVVALPTGAHTGAQPAETASLSQNI